MINWARFWKTPKTQAFGQTVLPDMSRLKGQKLVENGKIEKKTKCDIFGDFRTLRCESSKTKSEKNVLKSREMIRLGESFLCRISIRNTSLYYPCGSS